MDLEQQVPTINIDCNEDCQQPQEYHLIPFELSKSVPKVPNCLASNYFYPTIKQHKDNQLTSVLHGHRLYAKKINPSQLYHCVVSRQQGKPNNLSIIAINRIQHITDWCKDKPYNRYEGNIGTIDKYVQIQQILHCESQQ